MNGDTSIGRLQPPRIVQKILSTLDVTTVAQLAALVPADIPAQRCLGPRRRAILEELTLIAQAALAEPPAQPVVPSPGAFAQSLTSGGLDLTLDWRDCLLSLSPSAQQVLIFERCETLGDIARLVDSLEPPGWAEGPGNAPWHEAMRCLTARTVYRIKRLRLKTVEDVRKAWLAGKFMGAWNVGRTSRAEISVALIRLGIGLPGADRLPAVPTEVLRALKALPTKKFVADLAVLKASDGTAENFVARCLIVVRRDLREAFRQWLLDDVGFTRLKRDLRLPVTNPKRDLHVRLQDVQRRFGAEARLRVGPLLAHIETRGALVHRQDLVRMQLDQDVRDIRWAVAVAGGPLLHLWRSDFLSSRRRCPMDNIAAKMRKTLLRRSAARRTLEALGELMRTRMDVKPSDDLVRAYAITALGASVLPDSRLEIPRNHRPERPRKSAPPG